MPDRFLREALLTSRWARVSRGAQLLYIRLLLKVCDHGLYEADTTLLAGVCFPLGYRAWPKQIGTLLHELEKAGLVRLYEANGKPHLQLLRWKERARGRPKFPPPNGENGGNPAEIPQRWANPWEKKETDLDTAENLEKGETFEAANPINTGLAQAPVQTTGRARPLPKPAAHMPKPLPRRGNGGRGFYRPGGF